MILKTGLTIIKYDLDDDSLLWHTTSKIHPFQGHTNV